MTLHKTWLINELQMMQSAAVMNETEDEPLEEEGEDIEQNEPDEEPSPKKKRKIPQGYGVPEHELYTLRKFIKLLSPDLARDFGRLTYSPH